MDIEFVHEDRNAARGAEDIETTLLAEEVPGRDKSSLATRRARAFLLEALGQAVVETGRNVAWFTLEQVGDLVRRHRADDSVTRAIARILRADLVVVDDIGLLPVGPDATPATATVDRLL